MARPHQRLETLAVAVVALLAAAFASRELLRPDHFSGDAFVHQYWMWSFRDPALFTDPLTAALRESGRYPLGYQALFWVAAQVASPIAFGEWLGVVLMAASAVLVFAIVREHGGWRPGAWIAAGLFLALLDIHRFAGGFQRAFVHPAVLLTVLLCLRGRPFAAALTVVATVLVYPPAALLAGGVLALTAVAMRDRQRLLAAGAAAVVSAAIILAQGGTGEVLTAAQARLIPEFGPSGTLRFFSDSTLGALRQNRSGFDLRESGSTLLIAATALLLVPGTLRRLRPEVLALPVVSLGLFVLAQLVLFRLYLPHRYTYPLVAFGAITVGVGLYPAWAAAVASRRRALLAAGLLVAPVAAWLLARYAFPLGPLQDLPALASATVVGTAVAAAAALAGGAVLRRAALGAAATGVLLVALQLHAGRMSGGNTCPDTAATRYLASLPKDAIVAGDPGDLQCLPGTIRRAVVISNQLAPSYEPAYLRQSRARMFAMLRAYYGPDPAAIDALGTRYGATALWVRREAIEGEREGGRRWRGGVEPFGAFVRGLLREGEPATLRLPADCRTFRAGRDAVYSIPCLGRARARESSRR